MKISCSLSPWASRPYGILHGSASLKADVRGFNLIFKSHASQIIQCFWKWWEHWDILELLHPFCNRNQLFGYRLYPLVCQVLGPFSSRCHWPRPSVTKYVKWIPVWMRSWEIGSKHSSNSVSNMSVFPPINLSHCSLKSHAAGSKSRSTKQGLKSRLFIVSAETTTVVVNVFPPSKLPNTEPVETRPRPFSKLSRDWALEKNSMG